MDTRYYLEQFQKAAARLDRKRLEEKRLVAETGIWLHSAALKIKKDSWSNASKGLSQPGASIFFSIWLNDAAIKETKLLYNIHALKLRQLSGYRIASRDFAADFRKKFKQHQGGWPNVSIQYGPLTLMQGWQKINPGDFQDEIIYLSNKFLGIEYLIDELLAKRRADAV